MHLNFWQGIGIGIILGLGASLIGVYVGVKRKYKKGDKNQ
jgi:hypothetical protein